MSMQAEMFKDTTILSIELNCPGSRHKIDPELVQLENTSKDWVSSSKLLLDCPELAAIRSVQGDVRKWLKLRRVPVKFFRAGCYLVRRSLVPEINAYVSAKRAELSAAVEDFLLVYEDRKAQASEKLGDLYDETDYLTPDQWRRGVEIVSRYVSVTTDVSLREVDPQLYRQQCEQAEAEFARAVEEIRLALRQSAQELVAHAVDRLSPTEDGQPKQIRENTFHKLTEFLEFFEAQDITNDAQMAALVSQARQALQGVTIERLRDDEQYRRDMLEQFSKVKDELDSAVTVQVGRLIEFDSGPDSVPESMPELCGAA